MAKPGVQTLPHSRGPWWAGLADTYPSAVGVLLQKLSKLGQEDVPGSFTLQGKETGSCEELRMLAPDWTSSVLCLSLDPAVGT